MKRLLPASVCGVGLVGCGLRRHRAATEGAFPVKRAILAGASALVVSLAAPGLTQAATTSTTGGGAPFQNFQRSFAATQVMVTQGVFPGFTGMGGAVGDTLGFVYGFAGNFRPGSSLAADGQLLSISQHVALFSLLGSTYGGDGVSAFALPNLQGVASLGAGRPGGLGVTSGSPTLTLTPAQIPAHDHTLPGGGVTGLTGGGDPFSTLAPSLSLKPLIAVIGRNPDHPFGPETDAGSSAFLGQVVYYAGDALPDGWAVADGNVIDIAADPALFAVIGATYGGDGVTTFALPNLEGRVAVGADAIHPLGSSFGAATTQLTVDQLPAHDHGLPGGGDTGVTGGGQPFDKTQPSLALNYIINLDGRLPQPGFDFDPTTPTVGEITEFAGAVAPTGWAFLDGQLLLINRSFQLFYLLGNQFGGDGQVTFALPDLRGRTLIGAGSNFGDTFTLGEVLGANQITLTADNLPAHDHTLPAAGVPEPATWGLIICGFGLAGGSLRRRRSMA